MLDGTCCLQKDGSDGSILVDGKATGSWEERDGKLCTTLAGGPDGAAQTACSSLDDVSATKVGDTPYLILLQHPLGPLQRQALIGEDETRHT